MQMPPLLMMMMMMQMLWLRLRLATFLELIETPEDFNEGSTAAAEDEANTEAATVAAVINALSMQHAACNRTEQNLQLSYLLGLFKLTNSAVAAKEPSIIMMATMRSCCTVACGMWQAALAHLSVAEQAWQSIWQTWHNNLFKPRTKLLTKKKTKREAAKRERNERRGGREKGRGRGSESETVGTAK